MLYIVCVLPTAPVKDTLALFQFPGGLPPPLQSSEKVITAVYCFKEDDPSAVIVAPEFCAGLLVKSAPIVVDVKLGVIEFPPLPDLLTEDTVTL